MVTIPLAAPARHLISVEAFHRMDETGILGPADRVELIDGEIIDRSPIGALHAAIVDLLARHFGRSAQASVFIRCQNPLRLDDLSEPEPDIAIPGLGTFSSRVVNDSPRHADIWQHDAVGGLDLVAGTFFSGSSAESVGEKGA